MKNQNRMTNSVNSDETVRLNHFIRIYNVCTGIWFVLQGEKGQMHEITTQNNILSKEKNKKNIQKKQ